MGLLSLSAKLFNILQFYVFFFHHRNTEKRIITKRIARRNTRLKCAKCERSFQKYENFEAHMRSHFGKKVLSFQQTSVS